MIFESDTVTSDKVTLRCFHIRMLAESQNNAYHQPLPSLSKRAVIPPPRVLRLSLNDVTALFS